MHTHWHARLLQSSHSITPCQQSSAAVTGDNDPINGVMQSTKARASTHPHAGTQQGQNQHNCTIAVTALSQHPGNPTGRTLQHMRMLTYTRVSKQHRSSQQCAPTRLAPAVVCMSPCAAVTLPQHTQMPLIAWVNQSHRSHVRQNQWQLAHVTHPKAAPSEVQACDACGCTLPCCIRRTGNRTPPPTATPTPIRLATSTASDRIGFYPMPSIMCGSIHSSCTSVQPQGHLLLAHHHQPGPPPAQALAARGSQGQHASSASSCGSQCTGTSRKTHEVLRLASQCSLG
jgi:hypothetical protein